MGLANFFLFTCCNVNTAMNFAYLKLTTNIDNRRYDVNLRMANGVRACGEGYAGMEKYCTLVKMPKPITQSNGLFC